MATGATYVDFGSEKRLLGRADFQDRFLGHLRELIQENMEKTFRTGAIYDAALTLSAGGSDRVSIGGTSPATDGLGHILDIDDAGTGSGVYFQNTAAIDYEVALHYAEVPSGVQQNPRKGLPEYIGVEETIGESADPDLVTDNGSNLTFRVDSVAEAGVSHAGRTVRVFRKTPGRNATTPAIAIEDCVVTWTGSNNEITTSGLLGQDTVSTTPGDYTVVMLGPTIRRNSTLIGVDGYAFVGIVTGVGAGGSPVSFDTTDQDVITASLSDLQDITSRNSSTDRLKIDVKSYTGDVNDPQIAVRDPGGSIVFKVDGNGNVTIEGTTTQQDVVTVNSSETITDNLTAGDATSDSHKIKGSWWHTDPGETANYFRVDGATGRVGIQQTPETSVVENMIAPFAVSGHMRLKGDFRVESSLPEMQWRETGFAVNAGGLWRGAVNNGDWAIQENTAAAADFSTSTFWLRSDRANQNLELGAGLDFVPNNTAQDLGTSGQRWRNAYVTGIGYIDEIITGTASGQGLGSHLYPDFTDTRSLGSASRRFTEMHARTIYLDNTIGYGVGSNLAPTGDNSFSLGTATRRWSTIYAVNINFSGDFLPLSDASQDIGSTALRWSEGHFAHWMAIGSATSRDSNTALYVDYQPPGNVDTTLQPTAYVRGFFDKTSIVNTNRAAMLVEARQEPSSWAEQTVRAVVARMTHNSQGTNVYQGHFDTEWNLLANQTIGILSGASVRGTNQGHTHYRASPNAVNTITFPFNNYQVAYFAGDMSQNATFSGDGSGVAFWAESDPSFFGGIVQPTTDLATDLGAPTSTYHSSGVRWRALRVGHTTADAGIRVGYPDNTTGSTAFNVRNPSGYDYTDVRTGTNYGGIISAYWNNASSTGSRYGLSVRAEVDAHSSGTSLIGLGVASANDASAATFTYQYGMLVSMQNDTPYSTSSMDRAYGLHIGTPTGSTPFTDRLYGLYVSDQTRGNSSNYGLYIESITGPGGYAIYTNTGPIYFQDTLNCRLIVPTSDSFYNIGSEALRWQDFSIERISCAAGNNNPSADLATAWNATQGLCTHFEWDSSLQPTLHDAAPHLFTSRVTGTGSVSNYRRYAMKIWVDDQDASSTAKYANGLFVDLNATGGGAIYTGCRGLEVEMNVGASVTGIAHFRGLEVGYGSVSGVVSNCSWTGAYIGAPPTGTSTPTGVWITGRDEVNNASVYIDGTGATGDGNKIVFRNGTVGTTTYGGYSAICLEAVSSTDPRLSFMAGRHGSGRSDITNYYLRLDYLGTSYLYSSLYPDTNGTRNLGGSSNRWNIIYGERLDINQAASNLNAIINQRSSGYALELTNYNGASSSYYGLRINAGASSGTSYSIRVWGAGTEIGRIQDSGSTFQIVQGSDPRGKAKADGTPLTYDQFGESLTQINALSIIEGIEHIEFRRHRNWEAGWSTEDTLGMPLVPVGYRSDNIKTLYPHAITDDINFDTEGAPTHEGVSDTTLIPVCTKAIQELKSLHDALDARVAALEAA